MSATAAAGCTGGDASGNGNETTTSAPTTEATTTQATTPTTTSSLPTDCGALPDVDGLPDAPEEWTVDRARSYASEFERTYKPASDEHVAAVAWLQVTSAAETDGGRYVVEMDVEVDTASGGGTQTEQPQDATEHVAQYVLTPDRVVRRQRGIAANRVITEDCWQLSANGE